MFSDSPRGAIQTGGGARETLFSLYDCIVPMRIIWGLLDPSSFVSKSTKHLSQFFIHNIALTLTLGYRVLLLVIRFHRGVLVLLGELGTHTHICIFTVL